MPLASGGEATLVARGGGGGLLNVDVMLVLEGGLEFGEHFVKYL